MAKILSSFRALPNAIANLRRKDAPASKGRVFNVDECGQFGFPNKPSAIAFDSFTQLLAIGTRNATIKIYGQPGVVCAMQLSNVDNEVVKLMFVPNKGLLVSVDNENNMQLWRIECADVGVIRGVRIAVCPQAPLRIQEQRRVRMAAGGVGASSTITALHCRAAPYIFFGCEDGALGVLLLQADAAASWAMPNHERGAYPVSRIRDRMSESISGKLPHSLGSVVAITASENGQQVLLAYSCGVLLLLDLYEDTVVHALNTLSSLPNGIQSTPSSRGGSGAAWQPQKQHSSALPHSLFAAPSSSSCSGPLTSTPPNNSSVRMTDMSCIISFSSSKARGGDDALSKMSARLFADHGDANDVICAYDDGSVHSFAFGRSLAAMQQQRGPALAQTKQIPTRLYGPFPCQAVTRVFTVELPPNKRVIVFAGGMPRANFHDHETVTIMDDPETPPLGTTSSSLHDLPRHVCLDLSSRMVDAIPVTSLGRTHLFLLLQEELVIIDLMHPDWPHITAPYLTALHLTAVTTSTLYTEIDPNLLDLMESQWHDANGQSQYSTSLNKSTAAGASGMEELAWDHWFCRHPQRRGVLEFVPTTWPVRGDGACLLTPASAPQQREEEQNSVNQSHRIAKHSDWLLITGHEDGTVNMWRVTHGDCVQRVMSIKTARLFRNWSIPTEEETCKYEAFSNDWPPFRPTGFFDPLSDDSRLSISSVQIIPDWRMKPPHHAEEEMLASSMRLLITGAAGQVCLWRLGDLQESLITEVDCVTAQLAASTNSTSSNACSTHLEWASADYLSAANYLAYFSSLQIEVLVQIQPAHKVLCSNARQYANCLLLALATVHGVVLLQVSHTNTGRVSSTVLLTHVTVANNLFTSNATAASQPIISQEADNWALRRTREIKKSLRDSYRRIRRGRSKARLTTLRPGEGAPEVDESGGGAGYYNEREVKVRPRVPEEVSQCAVRCLYLCPPDWADSCTAAMMMMGSTLLAGTANGRVLVFEINLRSNKVRAFLKSEICLNHAAPIYHIQLKSSSRQSSHQNRHLPPHCAPPSSQQPHRGGQPTPTGGHARSRRLELLITSEEQIRFYTFPKLDLVRKLRITAKEGLRVKNAAWITMPDATHNSTSVSISALFDNVSSELLLLSTNLGRMLALDGHLNRIDEIEFLSAGDILPISSVQLDIESPRAWFTSSSGQITVVEVAPVQQSRRYFLENLTWLNSVHKDTDAIPPYTMAADVSL